MDSYINQVIRGSYMPHVDGIRALAVIAVVLYHLNELICPGGFTGVDVFFVISGYLIGGGIIRDLKNGAFSFKEFYIRRIKRIMPAYFVMITVVLITGLLLYHYEPLASLGQATQRATYFFANFFFYKYTGAYFSGNATTHALTNLWSLSVEEQFYIIIPFLMWLVWKWRMKALTPILFILALISFVYAEALLQSPSTRLHTQAFYLLFPRAWELLSGCMLAGLSQHKKQPTSKNASAFAFFGICLVILSYFYVRQEEHFPAAGALPAIAGAILLIRYGQNGVVGKLLTHPIAVWLGRISYSLYLWHWPVIVYTRYICGEDTGTPALVLAAVLSFALAIISWRYVEMPIRRSKTISPTKTFIGLAAACIFTGAIGSWLYKSNGMVHLIHQEANHYASLDYPAKLTTYPDGAFGIPQLHGVPDDKGKIRNNILKLLGKKGKEPQYVLLGDSHAEALHAGLNAASSRRSIAGITVDAKTCPLSGIEITNTFYNLTDEFIAWLASAPHIKTVILMCRWSTRLSNSDSGQILYRTGETIPHDNSGNNVLLIEGLRETCRRIRATGKDLVIIGPIPQLHTSPGTEIRRKIIFHQPLDNLHSTISLQEFLQDGAFVINMLRDIEKEGLARIVWAHPVLEQSGFFHGLMNGALFYHDATHLSKQGSQYVIESLFDQIIPPAPSSSLAH